MDISVKNADRGKPFVLEEIMQDFGEWSDMFRKMAYKEEFL